MAAYLMPRWVAFNTMGTDQSWRFSVAAMWTEEVDRKGGRREVNIVNSSVVTGERRRIRRK